MRGTSLALFALILGGCPTGVDPPVEAEPLDLPADPAVWGVPVGVSTFEQDGAIIEVWFPAPASADGSATELMDVQQFIPAVVLDTLGGFSLPQIDTRAIRDAPLRAPVTPYPVVVFSHGFGGFRLQSVDFATHLASRGYVVVAADHPGRSLGAVLPCLFTPPLEGCDLEAWGGEDPAPPQIDAILDWLELAAADGGALAGALDLDHIGLSGHSAGGATASREGDSRETFDALLPMGGADEIARDVPTLLMGSTCDGMFPQERMEEIHATLADGELLSIQAAGHLAYTDLCALELGGFAATYLAPRDDINPLFLDGLVLLAIDGCPGIVPDDPPDDECAAGYLPLEDSFPIVRHYSTVFFDEQLRGEGDGPVDGVMENASLQ
jgi:dienelactone hydrolase